MHKRTLLGLVPAAVLAGCGFRLRGVPEFSFSSLYIAAPANSALARELQRTLEGSGSPLKVLRNATKPEIKAAIEALFNVKVKAVNTVVTKGKVKRFRGRPGVRSDVKKAYVSLEAGNTIDVNTGL